jgi:adenosylmethionine-8-amino-7-oxononanoate aminotransferase
VADRATKAPFDPALKLHARIKAEAMARGLMVYPMGGTIDGARATTCCSRPPFIVDRGRSRPSSSELVDKLAGAAAPDAVEHTQSCPRCDTGAQHGSSPFSKEMKERSP